MVGWGEGNGHTHTCEGTEARLEAEMLPWKPGRATAMYNPAAQAVAASDPDEPKCYEKYWMIKGGIGLVHDLGLSKYKSAPLLPEPHPDSERQAHGKKE